MPPPPPGTLFLVYILSACSVSLLMLALVSYINFFTHSDWNTSNDMKSREMNIVFYPLFISVYFLLLNFLSPVILLTRSVFFNFSFFISLFYLIFNTSFSPLPDSFIFFPLFSFFNFFIFCFSPFNFSQLLLYLFLYLNFLLFLFFVFFFFWSVYLLYFISFFLFLLVCFFHSFCSLYIFILSFLIYINLF